MATVRVGVVGLGMAAAPHVQSLLELAGRVEVAGCFSPSAARREAFRARFRLPLADSLEALLADRSIEAMLVLTPPGTHLDLVRRCAEAGKHVLLEKPLEVTLERAQAVVETMRRAGLRLGVVLQHRFRPAAERLGDVVRRGGLGQLLSCSASVRWWRDDSYFAEEGRGTKARDGGGVLLTQAIHTLDLLVSIAGEAETVSAFAATSPLRRIDTEDTVAAAVRFAGGAIGVIDATRVAYPGSPERLDLAGTHGSASLVGQAVAIALADGTSIHEGETASGGGGKDPMAFSHLPHKALLADFVGAVADRRQPRISGEDALKVHRLIEALMRAAALRMPVRVVEPVGAYT